MAQVAGSIDGIFFENQFLTATGLGAFGNGCLSDGILTGCGISTNGTTVTMGEGFIVIKGRVFYVSETTITEIEIGSTYNAIVASVDTTGLSSEENFEQVSISLSQANSISDLISGLASTDINLTGTTASTIIAVLVVDGASITLMPGSIHYATARSMALLWENPNPASTTSTPVAFPAQSLTLPSIYFYDALMIPTYVEYGSSYNFYTNFICPRVNGTNKYSLSHPCISGSGYILVEERYMTVDWDSGIVDFTGGKWKSSNSGTSNQIMIPQKIFGMSAH